jgi:phage shock protein E
MIALPKRMRKEILLPVGLCLLFAVSQSRSALATEPTVLPKRVNIEEFDRLRSRTNHVVLDVRTPREFAAGHVPEAVNLDWNSGAFSDQAGKLDKSRIYLVHCATGNRSARAVAQMRGSGFTNVIEFPGGWREWATSGKPTATQAR